MNKIRILSDIAIVRVVHGGQGMGHDPVSGKPVFVWNALPGEIVDVLVSRKNSKMIEGVAQNIRNASSDRKETLEAHWLSCSPWQIVDSSVERAWKIAAAHDVYDHISTLSLPEIGYVESDDQYGYRNKMEWSFTEAPDGTISLAFFGRGSHSKIAADGCVLASKAILDISVRILNWVREMGIPVRSLKTLIVRSNSAGQTIAALFLKDELRYPNYPALENGLLGFDVYYSSHRSPASVIHGVLYHSGEMTLTQSVLGTTLSHGIESFFQVNIPVFEKAVQDIMRFLPKDVPVVDYYSGTGSIGLSISKQTGQQVICVESNAEAVRFAKENAASNAIHAQSFCSEAEKMTQYITDGSVLVLDPPRAGLHQSVIDRILEVKPKVIAYLSCNISTQARDLELLSGAYTVRFFSLYNFFPHTPHIEGLSILELKQS